MMKKILFCVILFILFLSPSLCYSDLDKIPESMRKFVEAMKEYVGVWRANHEEMSKYQNPYYTYDNFILEGVAYIADRVESGNFTMVFVIKNNTKAAIELDKIIYRVEKNNGSIYRLEQPVVIQQDGVTGSYTLNPEQVAWVACLSPFKNNLDLEKIKEVYIKDQKGRRVFFVPEDKIDDYKKTENIILRHLRNLWWNIR
ncbi:MAG: hypothetical protein KKA59_08420 [Candidatus Omnitrophica bacterium]|nr:hypothetical protein [Candidatus Omnitrophota bacterium]